MRLVSWIGKTDLEAAEGVKKELGPLAATVKEHKFSTLHLLFNYPKARVQAYIPWLKQYSPAVIHERAIKLKSPIDFHEIYLAADAFLAELTTQSKEPIAILLSPGTPTMQAVWILLGKTKYAVTFFQSSKEQGIEKVDIPLEIAAEFLPRPQIDELTNFASGQVPINAAFDDIVTKNPRMLELKQQASILATKDIPVLVYGESGTGKELFATAIHNASPRAKKAFIAVNCGAIPPELIDSTLFGHVKGAFTGATSDKKGCFQEADGGTLFLDEFGELEPASQVRLLRVLQTGEITPVGASKSLTVNVRLITATNKDLLQEVAANRFREDLFYRIAIGVIHLPPLRQREGDLLILSDALLEQVGKQLGLAEHKSLSADAKKIILNQSWRGNIRELQATLVRAALWSNNKKLTAIDIQKAIFAMPDASPGILGRDLTQGIDLESIMAEVARHYLQRALVEFKENKKKASDALGFANYQTLGNWLKKYNVK